MTRAVLFHGPGRPLEIASFRTPEPRDADILVRVTCCTLCSSDLHTHAGRRTVPTPTVLGHEIVGRIEAFGPIAPWYDHDGIPLEVGARVSWSVAASCGCCFFCQHELRQKCAMLYKYGHQPLDRDRPFAGGLADYVMLVPGSAIFRVPDGLSDEMAAPANCATATAWAVVMAGTSNAQGSTVLIFGAGILGLTACAILRSSGATVLVSDPDAVRRERALAFGANAVLSADATELAAGVADHTQGRGVDLSLELAGVPDAVKGCLSLTRIGGTVVLAGTVLPTPSVPLDPEAVVRRMLTIRGVHNYAADHLRAALSSLSKLAQEYPFADLIGRSFALDDVEQAFAFAHAHPGERVAVIP